MKRAPAAKFRPGRDEHTGLGVFKRPKHEDPITQIGSNTSSNDDGDVETGGSGFLSSSSDDVIAEEVESPSSSDEEDLKEKIDLSETIIMFPRMKLAKHRSVVVGEIRNKIEESNRTCVIKFDHNSDKIFAEARVLRNLVHCNIVCLYKSSTFQDTLRHIAYLVLEKCHDLNLEAYVHSKDTMPIYDINRGLQFCRQLINGLKFVHEKLIIHKDLKPSNILLSHDLENVKIADFGSSHIVKSSLSKVCCPNIFGTLGYRPPESLDRTYASLKSDIFSLGVLFCFLLSNGRSPFGPQSDKWDHNTQNGEIDIPDLLVPNAIATEHLIKAMLLKERCRRPSIFKVKCHPCWTWDLKFSYPFEEEIEDCEVAEESSSEREPEGSEDVFIQALLSMPKILLRSDKDRGTKAIQCESIVESIRSCFEHLPTDKVKTLSGALVIAVEKLMQGQVDEGVEAVKPFIPGTLSADDVNMIGKELDEVHPVCAIIMHRVAGFMYNPQPAPERAVDWIGDRIADISCVAEQIMKSDSGNKSDAAVVHVCLKFMGELLRDLRAAGHAKTKDKAVREVGCILSISRINLNATDQFNIPPNPNVVSICQEGLASLESGDNMTKHKYYGYLLNNIGEAYLQLHQIVDAEPYLRRALVVKKAFTYRSRETRIRDIGITQKNIDKLEVQKNSKFSGLTMMSH